MIYLYAHAGSGNHGCEALARTLADSLKDRKVVLISYRAQEDVRYGVDGIFDEIIQIPSVKKFSPTYFLCQIKRRLFGDVNAFFKYRYKGILKRIEKGDLFISIGGDNYCGYGMNKELAFLNREINARRAKTALIGCSIEDEVINDAETGKDLKTYSFISARETLTYDSLKKIGVRDLYLIPDSAFLLPVQEIELQQNFKQGNMLGINISPLIQSHESTDDIAFKNYCRLIEKTLSETDMGIALIPHVVWDFNDDIEPLKKLYEKYKDSGRIVLINGDKSLNCMQLKYVISKCRFLVTARTHASIAAYSTFVPTLVLGYSVKAKGIAKDIFEEYENYVLPVQSLSTEYDLTNAFLYIYEHEEEIRNTLKNKIPGFIEKAAGIDKVIENHI